MRSAILVADDDPEVLSYLETALLCHKYPVIAAQDGNDVLALLEENRGLVAAAVLDVMMPCKDGIETLLEVRRRFPELPVIMISGASDPDRIVEAMKAGAQEYLIKPVAHEKLLAALRRTLALAPPAVGTDDAPPKPRTTQVNYVQVNARMRAISEALRKTAAWNVPVVLRGESGVGKEVLARELHLLSPRSEKEFVKINCVALPSELLESELFGYERGAFTGAFKAKPGKFEMADGGTILLDEIGDMDLKLQAKLLQVLQDGEFHRLGGKEPVRVDVRVLVATHRDLEKSIEEGTFREDLYYRLNVVSIEVPPLRERKDEILPLAQHFLEKHSPPHANPLQLTDELRLAFLEHDWPGNVRELENAVRRYLVFEDAPRLAQQLLMGRSSRGTPRPIDESRFRAPEIAAAPEPAQSHPAAQAYPAAQAHPAGLWKAAAAAGGVEGQSSEGRASGAESGWPNGASRSLPVDESLRPPLRDRPADLTPPVGLETGTSLPEREPRRELDAPLQGAGPSSLDGLTSRLEHLEDLLGRLVSQAPEAQPVDETTAEAQPAAQNGQELVTLGELDDIRNQAETEAILAALEKTEWNRKKASRLLGTDYKALLYRMKKLGIGERNDQPPES
ncbi:MAG: sigma 54-interacting transcriptional regulator [Bryobacterales bacterium]